MSSLIKEAEKNIIHICKDMHFYQDIVLALRKSASSLFERNANTDYADKFYEGIDLLLQAIYARQNELLSQCFIFTGVGGEDAKQYAFEQFKRRFDEKAQMEIMSLLDSCGVPMHSYLIDTEKKFRKDAREAVKRSE